MSDRKGRFALGCLTGSLLLLAMACAAPASKGAFDKAQVDEALKHYSELILHMDTPGIVALFAPNGEIVSLGQAPVQGREAIRRFLSGFSGFKVLSDETTPTETTVHGNSAVQRGRYSERVRTPSGQEIATQGTFVARWVRTPAGQWLIQSMTTTPSAK